MYVQRNAYSGINVQRRNVFVYNFYSVSHVIYRRSSPLMGNTMHGIREEFVLQFSQTTGREKILNNPFLHSEL